jgi:hypothetical protein
MIKYAKNADKPENIDIAKTDLFKKSELIEAMNTTTATITPAAI